MHLISYFAEAVMHVFLGRDWRLVFECNDPRKYGEPDGKLNDGTPYDVYTRSTNRWGLSKKPREYARVYILTHYFKGYVFLIGYATLSELLNGELEKFDRRSLPISVLHPTAFLKSDYREGLSEHVDAAELLRLQDELG